MEYTQELKKIKKLYGEKFMHLCRNLFPTLLETEGKLLELLSKSFANNSRSLYEDITKNELEEEFKDFIYSKIDMEDSERKLINKGTPYELLEKVGYDLFECTNEEQIQSFKKYYAPGEELCTFNGKRLNRCVVFFAVRKDVNEIKRKDYKDPKREDKYGTSVMGIQFNKKGLCTVSIKNRYNHRVNNPDATYGNDLEKIVPGLTQSFAELLSERGLSLNNSNIETLEIPSYVVAGDGKYYKYNIERNGIYYCPQNIIIENGQVMQLKDNELLMDYFVLDNKEKRLKLYDEEISDSFVDSFVNIEKIEMMKNKENGIRTAIIIKKGTPAPIKISINENNEVISYENQDLKEVGDDFLCHNKKLREIKLPKLEEAGNKFLYYNQDLLKVEFNCLKKVGSAFLYSNKKLSEFKVSRLEEVGSQFLYSNLYLSKLKLPKLEKIEYNFLYSNDTIKDLYAPALKNVKWGFLACNECRDEILRNIMDRDAKPKIGKKALLLLDKEAKLTTAEVDWGARLINKIKLLTKDRSITKDDRSTR